MFKEGNFNNIEVKIGDIIKASNNSEELIKMLRLNNIKFNPNANKGRTDIINNSGTVMHASVYKINELRDQLKQLDGRYKKYPMVDFGSNAEVGTVEFAKVITDKGVILSDIERHIDEYLINIALKEIGDKKFPILDLNIDMLELIKKLPNNSANLSLFAIDQWILPDEKYREEMAREILRVIPAGAILLNWQTFLKHMDESFWNNFRSLSGKGIEDSLAWVRIHKVSRF